MSTPTQRPTPEVNAHRDDMNHYEFDEELAQTYELAKRLERELNDSREFCDMQAEMLACQAKRNAELQQQLEAMRDELQKVCQQRDAWATRCDKLGVTAMREAIKEACRAIQLLRDAAPCPHPKEHPSLFAASKAADDTMRKLQPFIK